MLKVKHIGLAEANAFVTEHHRHHPKVQGHKYSLACYDNDRLCGVAIVGHPQGIKTNDGETLEVLRLCMDRQQTETKRYVSANVTIPNAKGSTARVQAEMG